MELLATLGGCLAFGVGGAWLSRDKQTRRRLHVWLWPPAAAWLALVLWAWGFAGVPSDTWWALLGLHLCLAAVLLLTLVALSRIVTVRTGWFVVPYLVVVCLGAAWTWLHGYMGIRDAWL